MRSNYVEPPDPDEVSLDAPPEVDCARCHGSGLDEGGWDCMACEGFGTVEVWG